MIWYILGLFAAVVMFLAWILCKASGQADRRMEQIINEMQKKDGDK